MLFLFDKPKNWQFLFNIENEREEGGDPKWLNISFAEQSLFYYNYQV